MNPKGDGMNHVRGLADLHVHLEGAIPDVTLREIARKNGMAFAPCPSHLSSFDAFFDVIRTRVAVLKHIHDIEHAAEATAIAMWESGVTYSEIHVSPGVLARHCSEGIEAILVAVHDGYSRVPGIRLRQIVDVVRHHPMDLVDEIVGVALNLRDEAGIVALGLGGREETNLIEVHVHNFERAFALGLGTVAHAGEQVGSEDISTCLDLLPAVRIGHGLSAVEDPSVLRRLIQRDIPLEICLSSNIALTAVADVTSHPVHRLLNAGVPVVLGSDDPAVFGSALSGEFAILSAAGAGPKALESIAQAAWRYAFDAEPFQPEHERATLP